MSVRKIRRHLNRVKVMSALVKEYKGKKIEEAKALEKVAEEQKLIKLVQDYENIVPTA